MNIAVLDIKTLGDDLDFKNINKLGNVKIYDLTMPEDVIDRI